MTDTVYLAPHLERPHDSAFRGVCAALARTTGSDVVLWRVLIVVLSFFGGVGIFLYLLGMLLIPAEGEQLSLGRRLLEGPDRRLSSGQLLLLGLLLLAFLSSLSQSDGATALLVLAALGGLAWHRARTPEAGAAVERSVPMTASGSPSPAPSPALSGPAWTAAPRSRRSRSPLGGLTASLAVLVMGVLFALDAADVTNVPADVVLATGLGIVGLGLVAGSFLGRSVGLVLLAVPLSIALAGAIAVSPVLSAGVGDRTWNPVGTADYRLGVGEAILDLRTVAVTESGVVGIDARVDVGHLVVLVPEGLRVSLRAHANYGNVSLFGDEEGGRDVTRNLDAGPPGSPQVRLDLTVRTGQVEVRRG